MRQRQKPSALRKCRPMHGAGGLLVTIFACAFRPGFSKLFNLRISPLAPPYRPRPLPTNLISGSVAMKRCPQCEFIYEDDQSLCDMDGEELSYDPRPLSLLANAAIGPPDPPAKSRWRSLVLLAIAAGVLAAVLRVDYYNFTHPTAPRLVSSKAEMPAPKSETQNSILETSPPQPAPTPLSASSTKTRNSKLATSETDTRSPSPSPTPRMKAATRASPIVKLAPARSVSTGPRPSIPKREAAKPKPASASQKPVNASQKKESRISSLLKKTGQILKRPFKL
jgi:hypothetical protein